MKIFFSRAINYSFPTASLFIALFWALPLFAGSFVDHSLYAALLKANVSGGVVDYKGFKDNEARLDEYLAMLERVDVNGLDHHEQFAFYINAYNAWTIKLILGGYPGLASIKDLGSLIQSPWKKKICRINGKVLSLDHIEHQILRPVFKDPRVHFAINCASKSCPALSSEPYTGRELSDQLDASARAFINDSRHNRVEGGVLYVSSIFDWFSEDFKGDVLGFVLHYASAQMKTAIQAKEKEIRIKYLDYDWSLNGK